MKFEGEVPKEEIENENEIQNQETETKETNEEQLRFQLWQLSQEFDGLMREMKGLRMKGGQEELLIEEKKEEVSKMVYEVSEISHELNEIYKEEDSERESGVESQEAERELIEKTVGELTKEFESAIESLGKEEGVTKYMEELFKEEKDGIRRESKSFLSMNEEKRTRLKRFLEEKKQEAETQDEKLNILYKRRIQMIEMLEEAKSEIEK